MRENNKGKAKSSRGSCEEMSRLYAAREMSPSEVADFEAHLAGCKVCRELVGEWKELFSVLSEPAFDAARLEPNPDFDRPVLAFVHDLIGQRERAAEAARRAVAFDERAAAARAATESAARAAARAAGWDEGAASIDARAAARAAAGPYAGATTVATRAAARGAAAPHTPATAVRDALVRRRAIWVGITAIAAALVVFSDMLSRYAVVGPAPGRPYVAAITWIVGAFHKGFDWLVFSFMRGIKIGEVVVQIFDKLQPIWNALGVAAKQVDPQLIVMEVLLFMLSLVLLKGFLGTAPKGRCTNVGIIL